VTDGFRSKALNRAVEAKVNVVKPAVVPAQRENVALAEQKDFAAG
jgi:hypothetical protein